MVTSEVQRTLVKSPPELWAEVSDPAALARHLGDLGDVGNMRIVRVHAEERVDWEADNISGSVLMKASGWGTKVTLRASRELGEIEPPIAEANEAPEDEPAQTADAEVEPAVAETASDVETQAADAIPQTDAAAPLSDDTPNAQEPVDEQPLEPRRGFFSRLFRRRRPSIQPAQIEPAAEAQPDTHDDQAQPETPASAPEPPASAEPVAEEPSEPSADVSADLKAAEEVAAEEVTAVLTATLDRLGAAHHRPFSRS